MAPFSIGRRRPPYRESVFCVRSDAIQPSERSDMRILGNIPHPVVKITVFQLNMKYAVKLEAGLMEQTYKLRESENIRGLEDIARLLDDDFIEACLIRFREMNADLGAAFRRLDEGPRLA